MPTADTTQLRLMRERARALATLALTAEPGVEVEDVPDDIGIDMLARLKDRPGLRQFGVELRYVLDSLTQDRANKTLRPALAGHSSYAPFPYPVVLFYFTMRDEQAWYTWVAEPIVMGGGQTRLPTRTVPQCQALTGDAVSAIVAAVHHWYDAHYAALASPTT